MYSRAELSRSITLVVALFLTAASTGAMVLAMPSFRSIEHLQKALQKAMNRPIGSKIPGSFDSAARSIRLPVQIENRKVE